jgi:hypothetical protein
VTHVFLLSPAFCGGRRASILLNPKSDAATPLELRSGRLSLGGAFAFMSGLYFRGKLAYAQRFGEVLIITPTRGLQPPDLPFTPALLREFAAADVSLDNPAYRTALERDAVELAARLGTKARVILLGSVASGKYVDVLLPILGERLRYPVSFIGRGDMSRGGLLLRSAASGEELEYGALAAGIRPRGSRPPKLDPATRVRPTYPATQSPHRGETNVAVSWGHEADSPRDRARRGIVEPALDSGASRAKRLDAVVDIRLRQRPRLHSRPRS